MATGKPTVSLRAPQEKVEALQQYAEDHDLTNNTGDFSEGKALDQAAEKTLIREGYWDGGQVTDRDDLYWEAAKVCFGVSGGILLSQLTIPAPVSLYPHAVGFLLAGVVSMIIDRNRAKLGFFRSGADQQ